MSIGQDYIVINR